MRLILEDGKQFGVVKTEEALNMARERGLDLVEVAPQAKPPVCRIMDYGKYKFEQAKKDKEARKKQRLHQIEIKEIKLRPKIDEHDYNVKLKHIKRFLSAGNKVKLTVRYRGRERIFQEHGIRLIEKVLDDVSELGFAEKKSLEKGKPHIVIIAPKNNLKAGGEGEKN